MHTGDEMTKQRTMRQTTNSFSPAGAVLLALVIDDQTSRYERIHQQITVPAVFITTTFLYKILVE